MNLGRTGQLVSTDFPGSPITLDTVSSTLTPADVPENSSIPFAGTAQPAPIPHHPTRHDAVPRWLRWCVLGVVLAVGLGVRWYFLDRQTMDYQNFLSRWYDTLDQQGFGAFREQFADYNYPYLDLIWLLTVLHVPSLIGIKALSIIFDVALASLAYRIVALRTDRFWLQAFAFGVVFLLPSVIMNSAWWGQADAVYTACVVAGIYFLLRAQRSDTREGDTSEGDSGRQAHVWNRSALNVREWKVRAWNPYVSNSVVACVFFGLAISFKLQAIFVLPVVLWLLVRRRIPWYALLAIPAVYVLLDIPAVLAGASWSTALSVYLNQTDSYKQLTLGAANLYQLIPISGDATWLAHLGIGLAALVIVVFLAWSLWKKPAVTPASILVVATASAAVVPFLLPAMHDRYFYAVEILSVIAAFYLPLRFIAVPVLIQASAIGVYHSSLSGDQGHGMTRQFHGTSGGAGQLSGQPGGQPSGQPAGQPPAGQQAGPGGPGGRGGQHGPGRPDAHGGSGRYTSGRGDTALTVYASLMAASVLGLVISVVDAVRRPASRPAHDDVAT
ncbi:hypothetical protein [Gordonia sp. 852002-10350_SCH5691597]|uniref:hypothetical protein n=1 Tax=Gordonia sp. 852002-10350_SCH5691597 TaxID=1834085 RepID=UPI0007E9DE2A|nr:hypothetical protein [Gordonia sp. 852002-10350_SCH5691597]OBA60003.1 hypothetical protein A5777_04765 [Gordonia sp. 852002-10350_SCH5691597]